MGEGRRLRTNHCASTASGPSFRCPYTRGGSSGTTAWRSAAIVQAGSSAASGDRRSAARRRAAASCSRTPSRSHPCCRRQKKSSRSPSAYAWTAGRRRQKAAIASRSRTRRRPRRERRESGMRAVVQRVSRAAVSVHGEVVARAAEGSSCCSVSSTRNTSETAVGLAAKIAPCGSSPTRRPLNRSLLDVGGEALVVSQFTLLADTRKGNRPSFTDASTARARGAARRTVRRGAPRRRGSCPDGTLRRAHGGRARQRRPGDGRPRRVVQAGRGGGARPCAACCRATAPRSRAGPARSARRRPRRYEAACLELARRPRQRDMTSANALVCAPSGRVTPFEAAVFPSA